MRLLSFALLWALSSCANNLPCASPLPSYDHVLVISVDGLRSDALVAGDANELPSFHRLMINGTGTLNARTDPDYQVTLPNHAGMLTGRFAEVGDTPHGWKENGTAPEDARLLTPDGNAMPGLFDGCKEKGISTLMAAGKEKFRLFRDTWPIDHCVIAPCETEAEVQSQQQVLTSEVLALWEQLAQSNEPHPRKRSLVFLHYLGPDVAGHMHHWNLTDGSDYRLSVQEVDRQIAQLFAWLDAHPDFRKRTSILLTSDHGGGSPANNHHGNPRMWVNYIIPFLTWTGDHDRIDSMGSNDLYSLNAAIRKDPSLGNPHGLASGLPPIRNGEIANLARQLFYLAALPGSQMNASQDLRIVAPPSSLP